MYTVKARCTITEQQQQQNLFYVVSVHDYYVDYKLPVYTANC